VIVPTLKMALAVKKMSFSKQIVWPVLFLLTGTLAVVLAVAAPADGGILFLHLRLKNGVVTLVSSAVRPGVLKQPRDGKARGALTFQMVTADGVTLENSAAEDPSTQRLEYEDPNNPGHFLVKVIQSPDVEFTVRLPHHTAGRQVKFFRQANAGGLAAAAAPALIGTIDLPLTEGKAP
jgi:hypothetical protein